MANLRELFASVRSTFSRGEQQISQDDDVDPRESLYNMVRENKLDELKAAFKKDADLSTMNMLHNARSADMVDFLVAKGANVNDRYNYVPNDEYPDEYPDDSPRSLEFAASQANVETVQRLILHGAKLDDGTAILSAVQRPNGEQQEAVVHALLDAGASIAKQPVVHAAVDKKASIGMIEALLKHGADPNDSIHEGGTGMHVAAMLGQRDVVELLLDYGANPSVVNRADETPLHRAALNGHTDVAQILITRSDDPTLVNAVDEFRNTPLTYAAAFGKTDTTIALLESGADAQLAMQGDEWKYPPDGYQLDSKEKQKEAMNLVRTHAVEKEKQALRQTLAEVEQDQSPEVAEQPARRRARL